jgi:methylase of polypeptide subunit release factors
MNHVSESSYPQPPVGGPGPRLPEPGSAEALRADLLSAGFTADGCLELLGPVAWSALSRAETVPALRATRDGGALATLIRLFLLQRPVPRAQAAAVLSSLPRYEADGWLVPDGAEVRATVDVRPYAGDGGEDWWIVSDLGCAVGGAGGIGGGAGVDRADLVLGVGGASTTLAGLTVREPVRSALDLGTGSGVQALHASRHAVRVTATDVNARALRAARLTLALSGAPEADLRQGSLFEPVGEERYDLVVSNPPFVISPAGRFTYRDGGMAGDELCRALVRQSADHLAEGGWCQLLANWQHTDGQDWKERVTSWLPPGCDAWVVQREVQDVAQYAELWLRDGGDHEVSGIGFGWITLRHSGADRPSVTVEEWPHPVEQPLGGHIADWFARQDFLRRHDDAALLEARFALAPDVAQEQVGLPGAEDPEHVVLRSARGMRRAAKVDTVGAGFAGVCDGTLPAGRIVDAIAQLLGEDPVVLRDRTPESIRLLVEQGFLTPVTD